MVAVDHNEVVVQPQDGHGYENQSSTTGGLVKFSVSMPPSLLSRIDTLARRKHGSRSGAIRELLEMALSVQERLDDALEAMAV